MRCALIVAALASSWIAGCSGGGCRWEDQEVPVGYCGSIECNGCECWENGELVCSLIGCVSDDPCWATGALRQRCSREPIFEPCDLEPTEEDLCYREHGVCQLLPSGECGFVDPDGDLAACLAAAAP